MTNQEYIGNKIKTDSSQLSRILMYIPPSEAYKISKELGDIIIKGLKWGFDVSHQVKEWLDKEKKAETPEEIASKMHAASLCAQMTG